MTSVDLERADSGDDGQQGLLDEIDVNNPDHIAWAKALGNPLVWHDCALACLIFRGDAHEFLLWLVQQPRLDRVTAAAIFLHEGNGPNYLSGESLVAKHLDENQIGRIIEALCDLDLAHALTDNGIGLPEGWEQARLDTLASLPDHPDIPLRFLRDPINQQTANMPYRDIGEGDLMSVGYMRTAMPFLLD